MKKNILIAIVFGFYLFSPVHSIAQAGNLDTSFGINGIVHFIFKDNSDDSGGAALSVVIQPDKKIILGGSSPKGMGLIRLKNNGSLDSSFGTNGSVDILIGYDANYFSNIVLQLDGRIVLSGHFLNFDGKRSYCLARFNSDGSLDNTFNGNGIVITSFNTKGWADYGYSAAVQPDGKIIQTGMAQQDNGTIGFAAVRYNSNGTIDKTFGTNGKVVTPIGNNPTPLCVIVQPDGKILLGGYSDLSYPSSFALLRYNSNGTLDNSFGTGGKVTTYFGAGGSSGNDLDWDQAYGIALQTDGKIILTGGSYLGSNGYGTFATARYNTNGTLDNTFGVGGKVTTNINNDAGAAGVIVQPDGKIIVAGGCRNPTSHKGNIALIRYKTDGTLDSSFGNNGIVTTAIDTSNVTSNGVIMQPDGKIVVVSGIYVSGMFAIRYLSGLNVGALDFSLPENPVLIYPNPIATQAVLQYTLLQDDKLSIALYDMLGRQVQTFVTNEIRVQGEHKETLHLSPTLSAGNYILNISNGKSNQGVKIVKQK